MTPVDAERELWIVVRQALLMIVRAIERRYNLRAASALVEEMR